MQWSQHIWEKTSEIYDKIIQMPFNTELMSGELDQDRFKFYIAQDALYLADFSRALALIAARAQRSEQVLAFTRFAEGAIVVESALHEGYFEKLGLPGQVVPSPTCMNYTNFLLTTASLDNLEVAMAAILPCFWIYKKVGDHIYQSQSENINPYKAWIDTYAGDEFGKSVQKAIHLCDEVASLASTSLRSRMDEAYTMASRLEWMFWDSAYRMEQWPV